MQKRIRIVEGEPVIYQEHTVSGLTGAMPLGHHPILKLPDQTGAGILDMSPPVAGFTTPERIEDPANGGYSSIAPGREITDRSRVPTESGTTVDLTRYPTPRGFEDLVCFVSDSRTGIRVQLGIGARGGLALLPAQGSEGPRGNRALDVQRRPALPAMERPGRLGPGARGGHGVLSLWKSGEPRRELLQGPGIPVRVRTGARGSLRVALIMGLVPIEPGFRGVEDIVRKDAATVTIRGRGGERIDVPCRVDFL